MFLFIILALSISTCIAQDIAPSGIRCAVTTEQMYSCIGNPKLVQRGVFRDCDSLKDECEKMTCIFKNSGWLVDGKMEKQKVAAHFDQFATDNPDWSDIVQHAKAACLAEDLRPQGIQLDCPAYDILTCTFFSFIKNAQPAQWVDTDKCQYPKESARRCPVCSLGCLAPVVPNGSCNACPGLPRLP